MPDYDISKVEGKWTEQWEKSGLYNFKLTSAEPYIIDTPPPTVSGNMHIGHAFSYAQQDFIARYKRMQGLNVYYPFGTDDNGLPTERLVEKLKKVKSTRMQRPEFVSLCRQTITEIKDDFTSDWKRIGMSCDFSQPYSTIDPHCVKTSQASFVDLYNKGLIYRKKAPSMWCVNCQTAIAQAELEDAELSSTFNDIIFKAEDGKELTIATTRPELLPSCLAIFVHPEDNRYTELIGRHVIVPIFGQKVKVYADQSADPAKGSGIMMVCSYGDRFDADAIKRLGLEPKTSITKDGKMNANVQSYAGLTIKEARKAILADLKTNGLLTTSKSISHNVNVHDKCGTEIEILETDQWFIKIIDNKEEFLNAADQIEWYPEQMKKRYEHWVRNLNWDWCISRQRHFGVPFPVWYDKNGQPIVARKEDLPVDPLVQKPKGHEHATPESDVMDTWATSSTTPQIITNWTKDAYIEGVSFEKHFPTSLRPQAHDIIRTWAFYTIVKSVYHHGKPPWKSIVISGNVADPKGEKMSKSKGNVVYPREVIAKYGADALRYWAAGSKLGEDLPYLEKELVTGKKTVTKLWNAANFCYSHLENYKAIKPDKLEVMDRWILSEFSQVIASCTKEFERFNYSESKKSIDYFFWHIFCDNYLEIIKHRLYDDKHTHRESALYTLHTVFEGILKLFAPIMPYITEELYDKYASGSIHTSSWPALPEQDTLALEAGRLAVFAIGEARKYKAAQHLSMKADLESIQITTNFDWSKFAEIDELESDIKSTTKAKNLIWDLGKENTAVIK